MPALAHAGLHVHDQKALAGLEIKILDEVQGIVEAIVSVTAVLDDVGDIIEPGAYANTLKARPPKGVFSHDWDIPVAKTLEAAELMPGDPRLPGKIQAIGGGGLWVKMQFNLETQRGREAFSDVRFYGDTAEWSIGYTVPTDGSETDQKTGIRYIKDIDLFEYSFVLFGANAHTATISAKSAGQDTQTAISSAPWDGPGQKAHLPSEAESEHFRKLYAWTNPDGDGGRKGSYKFLHHFPEAGLPASTKACLTGIKMLNGSSGGTTIPAPDRRGVYEHLAGHLRDAGVEDIPDLKSDDEMRKMLMELEDFLVDVEQEAPKGRAQGAGVGPHEYASDVGSEDDDFCMVCGLPEDDPIHTADTVDTDMELSKRFCADCGEKLQDTDHKDGCPTCGHGFEIKLGDAKAFCHCEKTLNHPGPHGFADKESDMGVKAATTDEVVEESVTVSKAPNEPVVVMVEDPVDGSEEVAQELIDATAKAEDDAKTEWESWLKGAEAIAHKHWEDGSEVLKEKLGTEYGYEALMEKLGRPIQSEKQTPTPQPMPTPPPAPTPTPTPPPMPAPLPTEAKLTAAEREIIDVLRQIGDLAGGVVEKLGSAWQDTSDEKADEEDAEKATPPAADPDPSKPHAFKDDGDGKCKVCGKSDGAQIHNTTPGDGKDAPEADADEAEADEEKQTMDPDSPHVFQHGTSPGRVGMCELCGRNSEANIHDVPAKAADEIDNKINVALTGSFEDTQVRVAQALDGAITATAEGAQTATFVEATFADSVLVCAIDFVEGEPDEEGYASVQLLGQRYLSVPYNIAEGAISLGEATEVEVSGVLTPKASQEAVTTKTIAAIENKVGRTLSAANADKIREAVQSLIEVLSAAGIDVTAPPDGEPVKGWVLNEFGKIVPFTGVNAEEAKAEVKADDEVTLSLMELLQGDSLRLHA